MAVSGSHRVAIISIHALRKESDKGRPLEDLHKAISIHALRKESDVSRFSCRGPKPYFNPRSP